MTTPTDQLELELAGTAQTGPGGVPVIGPDGRPIGDQRQTAQIYRFPLLGLSPVAAAILRDMRRRSMGSDGLACHSIADGVKCSGAARHKVVFARRELLDKGVVTLIRAGDEHGASVWQVRSAETYRVLK